MEGKRCKTEIAGRPCLIEWRPEGWTVTVAGATSAFDSDLAKAIYDATGGLATRDEAEAAAETFSRMERIARG
jgi:hypothetical protein